jgi:hypothetical protein
VSPPTAQTQANRSEPLVAHVFPTFAVGGAQARFAAVANHFGAAFRHIIVSLDGNLACRQRLDPTLDVTFTRVSASKGAMAVNAWRHRRLLKEWKPDILVTYNWGAIEFALANIVPVTRHLHVVDGFGPEERAIQLQRRVPSLSSLIRHHHVRRPSRLRSPFILGTRPAAGRTNAVVMDNYVTRLRNFVRLRTVIFFPPHSHDHATSDP